MTVKELINKLLEEEPNEIIKIQVEYKNGYSESNKVELNGGSKKEVVLYGNYTDGDSA